MAAETPVFDLPYPLPTDNVDVAGDFAALAQRLDLVLQTIAIQDTEVRNNSGVTINKGDPVYVTGFSTKTTVAKCEATDLTTFPVVGLALSNITNGSDGEILVSGVFNNINTSSFAAGDILYVGNSGGLTNSTASGSGAIGIVLSSNASTGSLLFRSPKGNGTWGSLKAGLA
jgi:predicted RecA/RadA family phage recombinase